MNRSTIYFFLLSFFSACFIGISEYSVAGTISDSLTYYGHAFVKIKTADGVVIYIDPYSVNAFADSADIVLITHEHGDHNELTRVKQKSTCTVIRSANSNVGGVYKDFTIGTVKVKAVPAYNANHAKASCVGYVVDFNGIKLYHAGDTGNISEMADLASQNITYALLPMEGTYTVTPEVATVMAATINAKHDMPIHTMAPPDTYSDAFVARFTSPNKLIVHPNETIALAATATSVSKDESVPFRFGLEQNYPNPFNPSTIITYELNTSGSLSLDVFNSAGEKIRTLVNTAQEKGKYTVVWDAKNNAGAVVSSGVYFYSLTFGKYNQIKKALLIK